MLKMRSFGPWLLSRPVGAITFWPRKKQIFSLYMTFLGTNPVPHLCPYLQTGIYHCALFFTCTKDWRDFFWTGAGGKRVELFYGTYPLYLLLYLCAYVYKHVYTGIGHRKYEQTSPPSPPNLAIEPSVALFAKPSPLFTFPTNIVAGWEEHRSQSEHKLAQETSFGVLKYLDPPQCVQMNVYCNLSFQLIWNFIEIFYD